MADLQVHESGPAPAPVRAHACEHPGCNQSYARIEHLERHVKTHTAPAGYTCKDCGKAFARSDVLRRHTKIHSREAIVTGEGGGSAKRVSQACQSCATAKVRCNGGSPCERCHKLNRSCDYEVPSSEASARGSKRPRMQSEGVGLDEASRRSVSVSSTTSLLPLGPPTTSFQLEPSLPVPPPQPPTLPPQHAFRSQNDASSSWLPDPSQAGLQSGLATLANACQPAQAEQPVAAPSNSLLDSLLSLGFQQTSTDTTVLENDLSAAFFLPTDDNMFWSQFLQSPSGSVPSPNRFGSGLPTVIEAEDPASPPPTASTGRRPRILITAAGLPSRHGSPHAESPTAGDDELRDPARAQDCGQRSAGKGAARPSTASTSAWPLVWTPTGHESAVRLNREVSMSILATPVAPAGGGGPSLPPCDEQVRIALLETLRFAQLSDDEYHALYGTLARIPLPVFDLLLSLYFAHFHPLIPFLHLPSFNPKKTLGQLLLILLGIGAIYAPIAGALQLGRVLVEVARRGIERLINRDNRLARSLPIAQAQMLWAVLRWTGSGRTMELAAVFQSVHTTMLRQQRVFDESQNRQPSDETPAAQWSAFITNEERRRTAMACYRLDGEASVLLRTAPCINSSEYKTLLPCDDSLWTAPDAEAWLQAKASVREPVSVPVVLKHLSSDSATPLPAVITLSPLGAHVLVQALHNNLHHVQQLRKSGMTSHADLITTHVRRSLSRLARGNDEFNPCFGGSNGQPDDPARYAAPRAWYHVAQVATYIPLDELDAVARKVGDSEAETTRDYWVKMLQAHAEHARTLALHAGQLLRVLRDFATHGTHEPASLFYAALALYLYARSVKVVKDASSSWDPSSAPQPSSSSAGGSAPRAVHLDAILDDTSSWVAFGGAAVIAHPYALGSIELAGEEAARMVLHAVIKVLSERPVWRVGKTFIAVLQRMLARDEEDQAVNAQP